MYSRVALSSEPVSASSINACTTRANSSLRHRPLPFQVAVHPTLLAGLPQAHQLVDAVNQGRNPSVRCRFAQALGNAAVPGFEAHLASRACACWVFATVRIAFASD